MKTILIGASAVKAKGTLGLIDYLVERIYHRTLIYGNNDCISLYRTFVKVNWRHQVQEQGLNVNSFEI
mgnify:CR=1 FL=1